MFPYVISGGTFHASFWRIIGTLVGAFIGWGALESDGGSAYLLALFGVLLCKLKRMIWMMSENTKCHVLQRYPFSIFIWRPLTTRLAPLCS